MNILMVLDLEFPTDIRVQNEAISLLEAGHNVSILCLFGGETAKEFDHLDIRVIHRPISVFKFNKGKGLATRFSWFDKFVEKEVRKELDRNSYDAVHVHDLPLLSGCVEAAKGTLKLVADLHENFPAALNHYAWSSPPLINKLVSPALWQKKELTALKKVDQVIVVVEEAKGRLVELGIDDAKISIVSNTVNRKEFDNYPLRQDILDMGEGRHTMIYVGGIDAHRGLDTLVEGMPAIVSQRQDCQLLVVGGGRTAGLLQKQVDDLGLSDFVTLTGKMPVETMSSFIKAGSIGVIPHLKTDHTDTTIPHKLFQYMYQRKAVLVSNCNPLERIVNSSNSGMVFRSGDPESFSRTFLSMIEEGKSRLDAMGENGFEAVSQKYNWANSARVLTELYKV